MAYAARRIAIWEDELQHEGAGEPVVSRRPLVEGPRTDARDLQGRLSAAFANPQPRLSYRRRAAIIVGFACIPWISIFSGVYLLLA